MTQSAVETLHQAIIMAYDRTSDPIQRKQAEDYCVNISRTTTLAIDLIMAAKRDEVKFWCLQSCEFQIKTRWNDLDEEAKQAIRMAIMNFYSTTAIEQEQPNYIKNKLATVMVCLIRKEYPNPWKSFFGDLCSTLEKGMAAIDLFFRVLLVIDDDIIGFARDKSMNAEDHETATRVKDALRELDINQLVQIWFQILQQMHEKQAKLAQHCLQVIDRYINWMPLELVVNDEFMNLFFNFLNVQALQNETVDCLYEITKKSMPASKKMELIKGTNLIQVLSQCEAHEKSTEFAVKVAGLLGLLLKELIIGHNEGFKVQNAISAVVDLSFHFLNHNDREVVSEILEVYSELWRMIKTEVDKNGSAQVNQTQILWLRLTFQGISRFFNFPQDFDNIDSGDDDEMELKFRTAIDDIFKLLLRVSPEQCLEMTANLFKELLSNFDNLPWNRVEGGLHMLYIIGENVNRIRHFQKTEPIPSMLKALFQVPRDLPVMHHPSVCLEYFNIVSRYNEFFEENNNVLPTVLASFADSRGLQHPHQTVRAQAAYKMNKWVKALKQETRCALRPFLKDILLILAQAIQAFSECPNSDDRASHGSLSKDDMTHVCDTVGSLCHPKIVGDAANSALLFREAMAPLMNTIEALVSQHQLQSQMDRICAVDRLSDLFSALAAASKSFNSKMVSVKPWLKEVVQLCMHVYSLFPSEENLRHQFIFLMHQITRTLGVELVPFIPSIWKLLLSTITCDNVTRTFQLVNAQISKVKDNGMANVIDECLVDILQAFDTILKEYDNLNLSVGAAISHKLAERKDILKHYYLLLMAIVRSGFSNCLISDRNQNYFESILQSLLDGIEISSFSDFQNVRYCLSVFRQLLSSWQKDISNIPILSNLLQGQFTLKVFTVCLHPDFKIQDASVNDCVKLICVCQCKIYNALGGNYLQHVGEFLVTQLKVPQNDAQAYCQILANGKHLSLREALVKIIIELRVPSPRAVNREISL